MTFQQRRWWLLLVALSAASACLHESPPPAQLHGATSIGAAGLRSAVVPSGLRVHFRRPPSWTSARGPKIYFWSVSPAGIADARWPGVPMAAEREGWFGYTIPSAASARLIFNDDGAPQTADLERSGEGWYADGRWTSRNPDAASAPVVTASPEPGVFRSSVTVTLRAEPAVAIHYSLDPAVPPDARSPIWTGDQTFARSTTIWTFVEQDGLSEVRTFGYEKGGAYETRDNQTILQAFDWYIRDPVSETAPYTEQREPESNLWEYIAAEKAEAFYEHYFTHVWLPPTGKAFSPVVTVFNSGYAVYDHYDLGEFDQMGHLRTKYGTKDQLLRAVDALHERKLKVVADIVMNHMLGTDNSTSAAYLVAYDTTRNLRTTGGTVTAFLDFDFANSIDRAPRRTTHSSFRWLKEHFSGMENYGTFYLFPGKSLGKVNNFSDLRWPDDQYNSEYQYLRSDVILGADLDLAHPAVADEMVRWTKWLVDAAGFDGFRVDAVRHMHAPFVADWARRVKEHMERRGKGGRDLVMFGENWDGWDARLNAYLHGSPTATNHEFHVRTDNYNGIERSMSLLDVPLHYAFQKVSGENTEALDIKDLPGAGLVASSPGYAVTFVDNHDTIPTQPLASYINVNTKLQAYTYILLGDRGTPCVFYRDLFKGNYRSEYGNDNFTYLHDGISKLLEARAKYAYGASTYFGAPGLLGHKRSGDGRGHSGSASSGTIALMKQFDRNGNPTTGNTSMWIPDDGRDWRLFAGSGSRNGSTFTLSPGAKYAVWVPER